MAKKKLILKMKNVRSEAPSKLGTKNDRIRISNVNKIMYIHIISDTDSLKIFQRDLRPVKYSDNSFQ